jgi:hypothetical protein
MFLIIWAPLGFLSITPPLQLWNFSAHDACAEHGSKIILLLFGSHRPSEQIGARAAFKHRDFCLGPRPYMSFAVGADGIDWELHMRERLKVEKLDEWMHRQSGRTCEKTFTRGFVCRPVRSQKLLCIVRMHAIFILLHAFLFLTRPIMEFLPRAYIPAHTFSYPHKLRKFYFYCKIMNMLNHGLFGSTENLYLHVFVENSSLYESLPWSK